MQGQYQSKILKIKQSENEVQENYFFIFTMIVIVIVIVRVFEGQEFGQGKFYTRCPKR